MRTHLHKTAAVAAVLVSVTASAPVTFAQIAVQGSVNANTTVGTVVTGAVDTSIKADVRANANANAHASTTKGPNSSANAHATTSLGQTVSGMVSGGQNKNAAVDIDAQIAQTLKASDDNVASVKTDDDSVTVVYKIPGKFLGIFPVHIKALVTTDASGKTKVHYPWYDFATAVKNNESLRARLESNNWSVTSSNKVQIAASIQAILHEWLNSNTSATASTTAAVSQ